jgi:soluble lytic murein transglycosylase-like protein
MKRCACVVMLVCCAACDTPARADIYAYAQSGDSILLTNLIVRDRQAFWTIHTAEPDAAVAKPAPLKARDRYQDEVLAVARKYAVDLDLIHAVIATESNYISNAVSPKGAAGLMQLMPSLAKKYGVTDAFDAVQNIRGGVQYLSYLLRAFDGNIELVLASYNAGEAAVLKYGRRVPPFPETINYVRAVRLKYRERKKMARLPSCELSEEAARLPAAARVGSAWRQFSGAAACVIGDEKAGLTLGADVPSL